MESFQCPRTESPTVFISQSDHVVGLIVAVEVKATDWCELAVMNVLQFANDVVHVMRSKFVNSSKVVVNRPVKMQSRCSCSKRGFKSFQSIVSNSKAVYLENAQHVFLIWVSKFPQSLNWSFELEEWFGCKETCRRISNVTWLKLVADLSRNVKCSLVGVNSISSKLLTKHVKVN